MTSIFSRNRRGAAGAALFCLLITAGSAFAEEWPSDRSGLVFAYGGKNSLLVAIQADGKQDLFYSLYSQFRPYGWARRDRFGGLIMSRGCWLAPDMDAVLAEKAAASGEFSFSARLEPRLQTLPEPGLIVALAGEKGSGFAVRQEGADLLLAISSGGKTTSAKVLTLSDTKPFHLALSWSKGKVNCWRDGKIIGTAPLAGATADWTKGNLVFGANADSKQAWAGRLEALILRSRQIDDASAAKEAQEAQALRAGRSEPRIQVRVKPIVLSKPPALDALFPYFQALVASTYQVQEVLQGECPQREIAVLQWAVLAETVTPYQHLTAADGSVILELEPWSLYVDDDGNGPYGNEHRSDDLDGRFADFKGRTYMDLGTTWLDAAPPR